MPSTFFIEDILRSEPTRPRCMQSNANHKANQLFSPINLQQKNPNSRTANLPISYHDVDLSRMYDNSSIDEYNLNIQNISSSTSSSPSSRSDSSTGSQQCVQPDPILNQFYSRLIYLNYQKICQDATASVPNNNQLFANICQDQQQPNNHQAHSVNAKKAFKKFESRKPIHEADDLNVDDQQSSCSSSNTDCNSSGVSPLDALFNMATTTFVSKPSPGNAYKSPSQKCQYPKIQNIILDMVGKTSIETTKAIKRKRKNRTAFTAHQIYELEKRFANQRYLSPTDRDRISQELCLSTAQVITWFQNRRAKQKRDIEELKNDVIATKTYCLESRNNSLNDEPDDNATNDDDDDEEDDHESNELESNLSYTSNKNYKPKPNTSHSDISMISSNMSIY